LLRQRRSVRAFQSRSVEPEKLQAILAAANSAPSAGNLQAYEIVVVRDKVTRAALVPATRNQAFVGQAPIYLMFCAHAARSAVKYGPDGGAFFSLQDTTIACAYAELATTALGLATVWIGALDVAAVVQITRIDPAWKPIALLPIGYAAEAPPPTPRRSLPDLSHELRPR
jgi:nitroreductase